MSDWFHRIDQLHARILQARCPVLTSRWEALPYVSSDFSIMLRFFSQSSLKEKSDDSRKNWSCHLLAFSIIRLNRSSQSPRVLESIGIVSDHASSEPVCLFTKEKNEDWRYWSQSCATRCSVCPCLLSTPCLLA